jgi:diguanylate cyclase (GGDEF)-like protein/PAS domain S-box-containing protein
MHDLLGYEENALLGRDIGEIVVEEEFIRRKFARIRHGLFDASDEMLINCRTKTGLKIPVLAGGSSISSSVTGERDIILLGAALVADTGPELSPADNVTGKAQLSPQTGAEETIAHNVSAGNAKTDVVNAQKTAEEYKRLVDTALVGVFIAGKNGLTYANRKMAEMFGYSEGELAGSKLMLDLVEEQDRETVADYLNAVLRNGSKSSNISFRGRQKNGGIIDIEAECVSTEIGGEKSITGSLLEITERKIMEEAMRHQALHDPLTSLPNRMLFSDRLDMAISKAARDKTKVAVMFLDLDRFKTINDKFGHNIGDMLLQSAAGVLRSCLRDSDTVARLGGDEFTVLLSSIANREDATKVVLKILSAVNQKWNLAGHKLHLTTSAGISIYPDDGSDSETLIRKADTSMYSAKATGGNAYRFYEPHMDTRSAEQIQPENGEPES